MHRKPKAMKIELIQTGDVAHCRGKKLLAKAIIFMTHGKFSHSAIFWRDEEGVLFACDSQKDGFNPRRFDLWVAEFGYEFKVTRSNKDKVLLERRIKALWGVTSYDFEGTFIKQPIKIVTAILNRVRKNDKEPWKYRGEKKENERMYCSEAVAHCLGLPDSYQLSPQELWDYCSKNHSNVEI